MITNSQRQILEAVLESLPEEPGVNKGSIDPLENKLYGYKLALNDVRAIINEFLKTEEVENG